MRALYTAMAAAILCLPGLTAEASGGGTIFRPSTGLWAIQGVTRFYFGRQGDTPVMGDYTGDHLDNAAIFRASSGLWAIRGVTRVYFGTAGDEPKPGDYTGDGTMDIAIFRPFSGLWAVRGVTRRYFGTSGDMAVAPVPKSTEKIGLLQTGQTTTYEPGDDGYYQKGIAFSYQTLDPAGNGEIVTVDNVTGLM